MRLDDVEGDNSGVEDRRGGGGPQSGGGSIFGSGGFPFPTGGGGGRGKKGGIGVVVIMAIALLVGKALLGGGGGGGSADGGFGDILGQLGGGTPAALNQDAPAAAAGDAKDAQYVYLKKVRTVLNEYWGSEFKASNQTFTPAGLVIFDAPTQTGGCGVGTPEAGPFYCPGDSKMYIDFDFYAKLEKQLGFNGDFAMAYVVAHEYGHHIQNLLGINQQVQDQSRGASQNEVNALSVKTELQADCFAGAWAKSAYEDKRLEAGDFDEAIGAAKAVGDDAIQRQTRGTVDKSEWTHGSSADRQKWFKTGYETGDPSQCNTFG